MPLFWKKVNFSLKNMFVNIIVFADLQFSSEEELDEVPLNEFEDNKGLIISAEIPIEEVNADDDSQQAAEAMVQLGSMAFYQPNEGDFVYKGIIVLFFFSTIYHYFNLLFVIFKARV